MRNTETDTSSRESHARSILKACTWRIVASGTTLAISYAVTGKTSLALTIAGVEGVIKMVIYYLHERAWQLAARGTVRKLFGRQEAAARPAARYTRVGNGQQARVL